MRWIVKMWHLGKDALTGYSGENFEMNWKDILKVFHHIYSKEYEGKRIRKKNTMEVRDEVQEYPNKPLRETLMDKIKDDNSDYTFIAGI